MLALMQLQPCVLIGRDKPKVGPPQPIQARPVILHPQAQPTFDELALRGWLGRGVAWVGMPYLASPPADEPRGGGPLLIPSPGGLTPSPRPIPRGPP